MRASSSAIRADEATPANQPPDKQVMPRVCNLKISFRIKCKFCAVLSLRAPANYLAEGPRRSDSLALPSAARALRHGLVQGQSSTKGGGRNLDLDMGAAEFCQG